MKVRRGQNSPEFRATLKAIEAAGFRDPPLHQLAMMLHDAHPLHPPPAG
jgi:cation transport protein ChaC